MHKVLYVYPRRNKPDRITTNISQGARGDPGLLKKIPQNLIVKAKKTALKATKALGLKFAGVDICLDKNLRDVYIIDVNLFSGFPKSRTFNLARSMIEELNVLVDSGGIAFTSLKNSL